VRVAIHKVAIEVTRIISKDLDTEEGSSLSSPFNDLQTILTNLSEVSLISLIANLLTLEEGFSLMTQRMQSEAKEGFLKE
jgi:hypothetical protein